MRSEAGTQVAPETASPGGNLVDRKIPGWKVFSWAMWDWGTQPFSTVVTTFVFTVYLTSSAFGEKNETTLALSWATGIAGACIALLAPALGQGSDRSGKRMVNLRWQTWLLAIITASLFFVKPDPSYLWFGLALLGMGNVVAEIANVNYYAAIDQVATPKNAGRVSGLGWGLGYLGGISILLLIIALRGSEFTSDDVRFAMLVCGAWTAIFTIPIFVALRDRPVEERPARQSIIGAYVSLYRSLKEVYRTTPNLLYFLAASALFRDGLAGVFTFGAVLAAGTYGFSFSEVIMFGVAANVVAGLSTMAFGLLDDAVGPKKVIVFSLACLIGLSLILFFQHDQGKTIFWIAGMALTLFVGPAQSASRSLLARAIPEGKSGEFFGLYATTGRAVSFLSPLAFGLAVSWAARATGSNQTQHFGILGIALVLLLGLLTLLPVKENVARAVESPGVSQQT